MSNKKQSRTITVCVVGLTGYDITEKCLFGVGKSCFCNRFVRPAQDEFYVDHTSIFSTSDFVGSVLNNDHFLYWGSVDKTFDENHVINFKVIEQTEFIDDASYMPLSNSGQILPYNKRATATKLLSPGKIMYISRDQVALQYDYEQKQMDRDGKLTIDAFICVYDVSLELSEKLNHTELQEDLLSNLLNIIQKTKKPVIVVATKCDESNEQLLQRAHQFVQSRKIITPLIESSAETFVNIELGFQTLVQLIDTKNRFKPKFISYQEGLASRKTYTDRLTEKYLNIVKSAASDSSLLMSWSDFKKAYMKYETFKEFVFELGSSKARDLFNQQAKKIKRHYEDKKLNEYLNKLPEALDELLPSLHSIEANEWKWENCQQAIKNHILFDKWFQILPQKSAWNTPEQLFETEDGRIPFDVLQVERSRACFDRHIKKLKESARKSWMKAEFRKLLELTTRIRPGTSWLDAIHLLSGEESYRYLDEHERKVIFETYLRDITFNAKVDFQELLFESAGKFYKLSKEVRPSDIEMKEIYDYLQDDLRYKNLEYIGNARDILLFNHIALMQSPNRCLSGPDKCMDRLMQQVVEMTARRNVLNPYENDLFRDNEDEQISVLVIGKDGLAKQLENKIKDESSSCDSLEYIVDGQIYGLNLKVFDETENDALTQVITDFKPQGYLVIYSNEDSLHYVQSCLEKIQVHDVTSQMTLPLNIIMANQGGLPEQDIDHLRNEGRNLANKMECVFVDYPYTVSLMDDPIHDSQVQDAIRGIVDVINKRTRPPSTPTGSGVEEVTADIKILLVAMCGDEYPVELILGTMLQPHACYSNPDQQDTIMMEVMIDNVKKTISVTLASYHRAYSLKNQLFHGYILAYSATRLASLETLRAFASNLPRIPVQVLAVTESSSGASIVFHDEDTMVFFKDGTGGSLSSKLTTKFQNNRRQAGAFLNFFNNVYDKRIATELTIQGIKKRRQGPLPDVPLHLAPGDLIPNGGSPGEGTYASIEESHDANSPYTEVALRHSFLRGHLDSDNSLPSSPDHMRKQPITRSRSSTMDSSDFYRNHQVNHDETGLYAIVDKQAKFSYIKTIENKYSEDEEDDMVWQDNMAYETNCLMGTDKSSPSLNSPIPADRPYATVPFLPKGHKSVIQDFNNKYATLPNNKSEPNYASIDQIRAQMANRLDYDPDSMSSISSKSKESTGSQSEILELRHSGSVSSAKKSPLPSPMGVGKTTFYLHDDQGTSSPGKSDKTAAPIAKPEDDENDDIKELRQKLEETLSTTVIIKDKKKLSRHDSPNKSESGFRKNRSESNNSTNSLDPRNLSIVKKMIKKVTPNPSPGNSDVESEIIQLETPNSSKKRRNRSLRKRKQSPAPMVVINNGEEVKPKNRSNTLPIEDSPKSAPKFASLDNRKQKSFIFKKFTAEFPDITLNIPTGDNEKYSTMTLDRKKSKKLKDQKKMSKDDLYLPLNDSITSSSSLDKRKEKKPRKQLTMSFKNKRPNKREAEAKKKLLAFEQQKAKNQKFKDSNYFGKHLDEICQENKLCPLFVEKIIKHVEDHGMQSEGIYRQSGNKNVIEAIMQKFEANKSIQLHELGVSVHAITGALKQFLNLLPEPLIPFEFGAKINKIMVIMDAVERLNQLKELVQQLPPHNLETFKILTCHLHRVTEFKSVNKMDVRNLQTVLYPTLMRATFDSLINISQNMNMGLFIQTCIEQAGQIFEVDFDAPENLSAEKITHSESSTNTYTNTDNNIVNGEALSKDNLSENIEEDEKRLRLPSDELSYKTTSENDISFTDSVLKDPGVEIIINSPRIEHHIMTEQDKNVNNEENNLNKQDNFNKENKDVDKEEKSLDNQAINLDEQDNNRKEDIRNINNTKEPGKEQRPKSIVKRNSKNINRNSIETAID